MKKTFIAFLIFFTLSHCGFSPIYNVENNLNYKIVITEKTGDIFINNFITEEISKISANNSSKIYNVKFHTTFDKIVVSKDTRGSPTEFQLKVVTNFKIQSENFNKEIILNERQNIKNISDIFQLKNYENTIKSNFAISIVRNLNLELLNEK